MNSDRTSLLRSIRGPIILITLGLLFTADYFGGYSFQRTWPVLLIVIGFLKLLEKVGAGGSDTGPRVS